MLKSVSQNWNYIAWINLFLSKFVYILLYKFLHLTALNITTSRKNNFKKIIKREFLHILKFIFYLLFFKLSFKNQGFFINDFPNFVFSCFIWNIIFLYYFLILFLFIFLSILHSQNKWFIFRFPMFGWCE